MCDVDVDGDRRAGVVPNSNLTREHGVKYHFTVSCKVNV